MTFTEIHNALKEVSTISSTNEKISWVKNHQDPDFLNLLKWYLDTSIVTGIAEKKFDKVSVNSTFEGECTFDEVISYLAKHKTGTDEDVKVVKSFQNAICKDDEEKETFRKLVCKNYPMGLKEGIVNKAVPGLVPTYEVMLADRYYDLNDNRKKKIFKPGREFALQEKLDGFRLTIHKNGNDVRCVSRQGKLITGLNEIENEARKFDVDNFVLDGEILLTERENIPSKLQYKATSKIVSSKEENKTGVTINVFDWVTTDVWNSQKSVTPYSVRYSELESHIKSSNINTKLIHLVENLYIGSDESVIDTMIVDAKAKEWEGLMIRFMDSPYTWKRSKDLLKVKPFKELDAYIVGYEEGTNANAGRLGALLCEVEYEGKKLKFKVGGGYSEDERIDFWNRKGELVGRIMSVQYFEITQNTTTMEYSVRFPEFLELKEEGSTINN